MTDDSKKPRTYRIIDKAPADSNPQSLPMAEQKHDLGEFVLENDFDDEEDDDDIYDPEMAGYDPRIGTEFGGEQDEDEFLIDCAVEWLPELPMLESLLEHGIKLDYGILVSAKVIVEELGDSIDEGELDAMIATLLLFGEEDEESRRDYYDMLTGEAQDLALMLDETLSIDNHDALGAAPLDARTLMLAGLISDIEVAGEIHEDEGELPAYEDLQHTAALMQTLCDSDDLPPRLVRRAQDIFNTVAGAAELPLYLQREGGRLTLTDTPPIALNKPKPPRP